jgi:hypothetical protein
MLSGRLDDPLRELVRRDAEIRGEAVDELSAVDAVRRDAARHLGHSLPCARSSTNEALVVR